MHVVYLIPTIDRIGGAERQVIDLAIGMAQLGWHATVIALSGQGGSAAQALSANNVSFLSLEMRHGLADPRGWARLQRWLIAAHPEVLHAHLPHAALMARAIRMAVPIRIVVETIHSPSIGGSGRRMSYRLTSHLPTAVTAVSRAAAAPWVSAGMLQEPELVIIPNGINTAYWKRTNELQHCSRPRTAPEFHWLAVGRLHPVKDHATLLRAFSHLPETARLTIAGTGPLQHSLHRLALDLGIEGRISFTGFQADVRSFMQRADAFVLSSRWEGLPLALMEASACELPSVFTGNAGCREVLPDYPIAPVPAQDPAALASAMQQLMDQPSHVRRQIGISARHQIVARFDIRTVLSRFEELYCRLLAANPQPSRWRISRWPLQAPFCSSTPETRTYSPPTAN